MPTPRSPAAPSDPTAPHRSGPRADPAALQPLVATSVAALKPTAPRRPQSAPRRPGRPGSPALGPTAPLSAPQLHPKAPRSPAAPPAHPPLPALRVQISRQPPPALLIGRSLRCLPLAHPRHVIPASARGITGLVVPRRGAGGGAGGGAPSEARRRSAALPQGRLSAGGDTSRHGGTRPAMGGHVLPWGRVLSRGPCSHMGPTSHRGTWLTTCCHADGPLVGPRSATGPHHVTAPHTTQPCAAQPYSGTPERPIPPSPHGDSEGTTAAAPAWTAAPGDGALCPRAEGDNEAGRRHPQPW